ncbi:MAG: hypothetical protein JJE51_08375 [Thermoanaerobaculia bacterium]|nr:hypothetical protein [Thermoanaerobaculia bacterium]
MEPMIFVGTIFAVVIGCLHFWNYRNFEQNPTARKLANVYLGPFGRSSDPKAASLRTAIFAFAFAVVMVVVGFMKR